MESQSEKLDRLQCSWHVRYQFCGLSAQITVYAESEAAARARAVDQLRLRGLKVACPTAASRPPWSVDEANAACFIVRDHDGKAGLRV